MSMRVSNYSAYENTVQTLQRRQGELSTAQMQLSSGKRISKPSDDPTGAARAERAFIAQERIAAAQRSVDVSRNSMSLVEAGLGQATDLLQAARESMVAAGDGSYSAGERQALAVHLQQIRNQLFAVANQTDASGGFIFGGQGSPSAPFLDTPTGISFVGTGGDGQLSATEQMPCSVDGEAMWLRARSGNGVFVTDAAATNTGTGYITAGGVVDPSLITGGTYDISFTVAAGVTTYTVTPPGASGTYTPGGAITVDGMALTIKGAPADGDSFSVTPSNADLNAFQALDRAIAVLGDPNANRGAVSQAVANGIRDIDSVAGQFQAARSVAGATLTRLDVMDERNQDRDLWAKSVQSDVEDLDMVQAVSDFQNKQTSYQAALQSYSMVHRMSMFDYLK